jgi:hypothetical protein
MHKSRTFAALVAVALWLAGFAAARSIAAEEPGKMLSHDVYFSLKDRSQSAQDQLVKSCRTHLEGHPGEVFFGAGLLASDLKREVNDIDFDVALHIVFKTRADHDRYQEDQRHQRFIAENQANWARVRVFDSYLK